MARYTGPTTRISRRFGQHLLGSGKAFERRGYPPGQHGKGAQFRRRRDSDYNRQLRAKQKARRVYGVLERQFRRYYEVSLGRRGLTGLNLLQILESRLDNVVYRAGFAPSRDADRQLVRHGHFLVNGKKVDIPSYRVSPNDIIEVREKSRELTPFVIAQAQAGSRPVPAWLEVISSRLRILVHSLPARQVIDTPVQEQLIVEFYSK